MRNDLMGGYSTAVKILKSSLLAGLKSPCFALYFLDTPSPSSAKIARDYTSVNRAHLTVAFNTTCR